VPFDFAEDDHRLSREPKKTVMDGLADNYIGEALIIIRKLNIIKARQRQSGMVKHIKLTPSA